MEYLPSDARYQSMKYNRVGRSGLRLPAVSLGFWHNFGDVDVFQNGRNIARRAFGFDRERVFRRHVGVRAQPIGDNAQRIAVDQGRHGPGAERSAAVALLDVVVVAVPMQQHLGGGARTLQP